MHKMTTEETTENKEHQEIQKSVETIKHSSSLTEKEGSDNVVFIGSKHLMNYVNSIDMQFKNSPEVIIKARGKFISKAIDIVEVAKRRYTENHIKVKEIKIGTEQYENEDKKINVSTIDIILGR